MERIEIQGEWWLPDAPDEKLSGTLIIEDDRIELAVFGALNDPDRRASTGLLFGESSGVYPRVHGRSDSKVYTLDDCFQIQRKGLMGGLTTQRLTVHQVFEGMLFEADRAIEFTEIVVKMIGLAEFVQKSGLSEVRESVDDNGSRRLTKVSFSATPLPIAAFAGPNEAECSLEHTVKTSSTDFREGRLTEEFALRIKYTELQSSELLLKTASHLRDLVSIATCRRAAFTNVTFRHPSVVLESSGRPTRSIPITMYANWTVKPEQNKAPVKPHQVMFTLEDIGGVDALTRWLAVAKRDAASLSRVMVSRYSDGTYITDNVLNAAAALEGYDRNKHGDDINLVERLKRCAASAGSLFDDLVNDVVKFAALLKDHRHDVAHHRSGVGGTTAQVFISKAAAWLLILCLLRDTGAPDVVFEKIAQHPEWRWLKGHLAEVIS